MHGVGLRFYKYLVLLAGWFALCDLDGQVRITDEHIVKGALSY